MKDDLELVPYIWPAVLYKIAEYLKRKLGESVTIKSSLGEIIGVKMSSSEGFNYINFLGVPYAKPPIGSLRFKDPEPLDAWTQPFRACSETTASQKDAVTRRLMGTEDCLHMNIYTKDLSPKVLRPVMVFLHGGAFVFGSNSKDAYNPEYLLRKDVVVIVVNYRLGIFGFLSVDDPTYGIPGNAGLKDQVMALKFIKENCERFGGDPNNITVSVVSRIFMKFHYHMISDISKGLFHKAILMSGTALCPWSIGPLENVPERAARLLGWNGEGGIHRAMMELQKASVGSLIKAQNALVGKDERKKYIFTPFGPTIEPYRSAQCFIDKHPVLLCMNAWSRKIPLLIGGCSSEGLLIYKVIKKKPHALTIYSKNAEEVVPFQILPDRSNERCKRFGREIKKYYFGLTEPSMATVGAYMAMMGDKEFWHGVHRTLLTRSSFKDTGATYLYRFDIDLKHTNYSKIVFAGKNLKGLEGACHGDDCFYLFKSAVSTKMNPTSKEFIAMDRMVTIWTSFAANGRPKVDSIKHNDVWEPISPQKPFKCLNISDELKFIDLPESERMAIWDAIYENHNFN
ncbi:hypothetical protein HA402_008348 [Bradysia odoriphaga]|nr:hypothetical protein HA402_008348 [Bradysia odoriphaga]